MIQNFENARNEIFFIFLLFSEWILVAPYSLPHFEFQDKVQVVWGTKLVSFGKLYKTIFVQAVSGIRKVSFGKVLATFYRHIGLKYFLNAAYVVIIILTVQDYVLPLNR